MPSRFTVATEDYPLTRRLYLYTATNPQNALVSKFVEFALSKAGQDVVDKIGFVAQTVKSERPQTAKDAPDGLSKMQERRKHRKKLRAG
jgi:phosphate transport system substrate-binding protein